MRKLARTKAKYEGCLFYKTEVSIDGAFIDSLCFEPQQSLDFALKAVVELSGERYVQNHDIRAQLNKLDTMGVPVPHSAELRNILLFRECLKNNLIPFIIHDTNRTQYI